MSDQTHDDEATGELLTMPEFAARCRERCGRPANGYDESDGIHCGDEREHDGARAWAFCGFHIAAVMGSE